MINKSFTPMLKLKHLFKNRIRVPAKRNRKIRNRIILTGMVSLVVYLAVEVFFPAGSGLSYSYQEYRAAQIMDNAIAVIRKHCEQSGIEINDTADPNRTGLIGTQLSELTTTLGHLGAKRTTTNPNMAALIVHLLREVGVAEGDTIAIGSSASFPALMIASLSAAKAMHVVPVIIISMGASSYGANKLDFTLLDMYTVLLKEGVFEVKPAAVSLGGGRDIGQNFDPDVKKRLIEQIQASDISFIHKKKLKKNVAKRMRIYQGDADNDRIAAFINTGGNYANLGASNLVLHLNPGINRDITAIPPEKERGVIFEMAAQNLPVIHLLYIKGLVLQYDLPWDPIPLPEPKSLGFNKAGEGNRKESKD